MIKEITNESKTVAASKGLSFKTQRRHLAVTSDPALLDRILRNLINNAVNYTEEGKILVKVSDTNNHVEIVIQDTGPGIPVEKQEEIFNEFVQIGDKQGKSHKGLGLGLSIVKRLCQILDIDLHLTSSEGKGTTFTLYIERGKSLSDFQQKESKNTECTSAIFTGISVWVIDDNKEILEALSSLLEFWGCECTMFSSYDELLNELRDHKTPPRALIIDYKLGNDHKGTECIEAIRTHFDKEIATLMLTGDTAPEQLKELTEIGLDLIHKPVKPFELRAFLSRL